jgi:SpoVK/Ycf46/Vps4 family AAA+-type ATPase
MLPTEEEQLEMAEIRFLLSKKKVEEATEKIALLIQNTKNDELKRQYISLLDKLHNTKQPKQKEDFKIKVEKSKTTFSDVKGATKLKEKMTKEISLMLYKREAFLKHKLKPSGLLLYGPPGTGKTYFLEALAGEFGMNMIKPDLGFLLSQWVGETEKNIIKMINTAIQNQPCIIILDETDSKIRNRQTTEARGESVVSLNATTEFLEKMQEVHNGDYQVIFTGASNRIWDIDPAAKRPGRLGTLIYVPPPTLKDRVILFHNYLKSVEKLRVGPLGYLKLALATAKYSPADIEEICVHAKKEMLYKDYKKWPVPPTKKITYEEYMELKGKLPKQANECLSTNDIMKSIRNDFRNSSLDTWYVEAYKNAVGWVEIQKQTTKGRIRSKTIKQKITHQGNLTEDDRRLYKDMLKDIKNAHRRRLYISIVRSLARL